MKNKHQKNKDNKIKKRNVKTTINKRIVIIPIIILSILLIIKIFDNTKLTKNEYTNIVINNNNETSKLNDKIIKKDNIIYMSIEDIKELIDNTIFLEKESDLIVMTSDKKLASIKCGENVLKINGSSQKLYCTTIEENDKIYIPISELQYVYDMQLEYKENTNIVIIDFLNNKLEKAYLKKNKCIKSDHKVLSKDVEKIKKGNWIIYDSEENGWAKVRSQNGNIGYIKKKNLDNFVIEREKMNPMQNEETDKYIEVDISKEDISDFSKREKLINKVWLDAVKNSYVTVKIICNKENIDVERLKIEIVPFLKESGIYTIAN